MSQDVTRLCVCPACRSPLDWGEEQCECRGCGATFARVGSTPILLVDDTQRPALDRRWYAGARSSLPSGVVDALDPYRRFLRPDLTYKTRRSRDLVRTFVGGFAPQEVVLNIGAGTTDYGPASVNVELTPDSHVDVVAVAEQLPFADRSVQGVVLMAVLEHVADADRTLAEAARVLDAGGRLLVDVPFVQGYHASPADYRRYTEQGLRAELERHGFEVEASGVAVGPGSAASWVLSEFLALLVSGRSAKAYRLARLATTWLALPLKYADAWLERHPMAYVIPSAVWAIGRRP